MNRTMIIGALSLALLPAACAAPGQSQRPAGNAARVTERRVDAPGIVAPPVSPEADPENVERRFGFAQARARREQDAASRAHVGHGQVDLVPGAPAPAPAASKPAAHDHGSATPAAPDAKTDAKAPHSCPCMAK